MAARSSYKVLGLFLFLAFSLFAGGCDEPVLEEEVQEEPATRSVIMGLIPEYDLFAQKKRYESLADYISRKAGVTVELRILSRYGNIIENFIENDLDCAFFGSFTGAMAIQKLGIHPIVRPEWKDGRSTYYGKIFVRKDSGITSPVDMKNKRFAFVDKATTAGWLLPLYYFKSNGIDFSTHLAEIYFTGTHEDAIKDVLEGNADIGAAKNTVFEFLAKEDERIITELDVLFESPPVPANGLGFRRDFDKSVIEKIKFALLEMSEDPEGREVLENFGARQFIATTERDYDPVFSYAKLVGIDLAEYDYVNN